MPIIDRAIELGINQWIPIRIVVQGDKADIFIRDMITPARSPTVLQDMLWIWLPAGIAIAIIVMSVNWIGDGLRDALDPRSTRRS